MIYKIKTSVKKTNVHLFNVRYKTKEAYERYKTYIFMLCLCLKKQCF